MVQLNSTRNHAKRSKKLVPFLACIPESREVRPTGDFTAWSEEGIQLTPREEGVWETELRLPPGEYQYRLRVDGQWQDHPQASKRIPNPFGSDNCVLTVDE